MAGATGLEPATSGVTGRRYNQLNYAPARGVFLPILKLLLLLFEIPDVTLYNKPQPLKTQDPLSLYVLPGMFRNTYLFLSSDFAPAAHHDVFQRDIHTGTP